MLFSEPKIPQLIDIHSFMRRFKSFSALQRAENSSMSRQKSPASRWSRGFSALQRAENSSIHMRWSGRERYLPFQCSSASRKFLNRGRHSIADVESPVSVLFSEPKIPQSYITQLVSEQVVGFSALQRAENSSIFENFLDGESICEFQCSSASRKFLNVTMPRSSTTMSTFQCSSASRKFLNVLQEGVVDRESKVSVLFSEPKIPQ